MPLQSGKARRLMGMALSVKRKKARLSDMPAGVRSEVRRLASSVSESELGKLASKPRPKTRAVMR